MNESQQEVIEQTMATLPFLDDEVPALYLADGRLYIPVCAVCHALGIRANIHIQRWRRLALWITARKLPLQTEKRGKRLVWCLLISQVPFLYRAMRQSLFRFLTHFADIDALLQQYADALSPTLDGESSLALSTLIDRGRSLFQQATTLARKMLHDQGTLPIIDTFKIDANNNVIDTFSMPLLPIVPHEDSDLFFALMGQLTAWRQELQAFWSERG